MRNLTKEQIEAIQNQQAVYNNMTLSDMDDNEIDDKKQETTDYIRRYINAYRNKDYSEQINKD